MPISGHPVGAKGDEFWPTGKVSSSWKERLVKLPDGSPPPGLAKGPEALGLLAKLVLSAGPSSMDI